MRARLLCFAVVASVAAPTANAKLQPAWLEASERHVLSRYFPGAQPTLVSIRPGAQQIRVVFQFRDLVACWHCSHPAHTAPEGRLARVTFSRATHRPTGAMKLCDARGVTESLPACFGD